MSELEYDLAEILRSPLEPESGDAQAGAWLALLVAFLTGVAVAAVVTSAVLGSGTDDSMPILAVVEPEPPPVAVVTAEAGPFPDDYTPIATDVALKAEAPIVLDDRLVVPVTMVVRRGAEVGEVTRPLGARWELRTERGIVSSQRSTYDPFLPSVFSVEFPLVDGLPASMVMVERWDGKAVAGMVELPWPGVTFRAEDPISVEVAPGTTVVITDLELGNFLGRATWEIAGPALGTVDLTVELLDADGGVFGAYASSPPSLDAAAGSGFFDYFWAPGFQVDQDDATTLRLTANVAVGVPIATDIEVDLPG